MDPARHDSIGAAVRRSALRVPRKIALRFGERTWTYAALDRGANRIARSLLEAGLEPGARLAAYGRNSDVYFLTWLGCVRAGVIHVPVNYALRPDELGYIVRQCGADGVVCDEALSASVAASADASAAGIQGRFHVGGAALDMLSAALDERIDGSAIDVANEEGIAQILYTSGATAEPKGAVMTHAAVLTHYASCMVAPGVPGEIVHRSPQLMLRYWDKPEETAQAFAGGWFHSGDVAWRDEEGYLFVTDRVKDIINTGGVGVSSRDVEEALFTHSSVYECAVIALPDPKWIEAVTAVVVLRPGAEADEDTLIEHTRTTLAPFKVPKRVIFTDTLPRNTAGKVLKRELRMTYADAASVMG